MPYLAPSLVRLRAEVNRRWPRRSKASDGWLGDAAHRARRSEHNPDAKGCVHALDLDAHGIDAMAVVRAARAHPAAWYVIHKGTIWSRTHGWAPRHYTGPNPHTGHVHISIRLTRDAEDAHGAWLGAAAGGAVFAAGDRVLRQGNTGADVAALQRAVGVTPDGVFGPATETALRAWQDRHDLAADGIAGPATWAKILRG